MVNARGENDQQRHVTGRRTAEDHVTGLHEALAEYPESVRLTLTSVQGPEIWPVTTRSKPSMQAL